MQGIRFCKIRAALSSALALLLLWGIVVLSGCDSKTWQRRLDDDDPAVRMRAIHWLAEHSAQEAVPSLLARLDDDDPAVRAFAGMGLKKLTGQDFGYHSYSDKGTRAEAIARWEDWWNRQPAEEK